MGTAWNGERVALALNGEGVASAWNGERVTSAGMRQALNMYLYGVEHRAFLPANSGSSSPLCKIGENVACCKSGQMACVKSGVAPGNFVAEQKRSANQDCSARRLRVVLR